MQKLVISFFGFLILFGLFTNRVFACATCYGNPDHPMSKGLTAGVGILLGFIIFLLVVFAGFFLFLRNRQKKIRN